MYVVYIALITFIVLHLHGSNGQRNRFRIKQRNNRFFNPFITTTPTNDFTLLNTSSCIPFVQCPDALADPEGIASRLCSLADGSSGVLCRSTSLNDLNDPNPGKSPSFSTFTSSTSGQNTPTNLRPLDSSVGGHEFFRFSDSLTATDINRAAQQAESFLNNLRLLLLNLTGPSTLGGRPIILSGSNSLSDLNSQSSATAQTMGLQGLRHIQMLTSIQTGLSTGTGGQNSFTPTDTNTLRRSATPTQDPAIGDRLPGCTVEPRPVCSANDKYRSITGECNNLQRPRQGRALTGFKRLLPNTYQDGIFAIRSRGVRGGSLPSARRVSQKLVETVSRESDRLTLSVMQWGQFIDHDLTHALVFRLNEDEGIECCEDQGGTFPQTPLHPQCIPIAISATDPFYMQHGQRCMSLVRSLPAPDPECIARPATPINEPTSYLDSSNVYGSQPEEARKIRSFKDGLMLTSSDNLLPMFASAADPSATVPCQENVCFRGGDSRVNEQSGLTVIHTVFVREHNRIAGTMQAMNPTWNDDRLFQEARRILNAEWQHVIYKEWLPVVVGYQYAREHGLLPFSSGFSALYDSRINPTPSNEFSTAAFRFGHSMVSNMYSLLTASGSVQQTINITSTFFRPNVVADSLIEHARTLVAMKTERFDGNFADGLHEKLFTTNSRYGLDLIALNIQRGRDHGIPTYTSMLSACTGSQITTWRDMERHIDRQKVNQLREVYDHPHDVDLFVGGFLERPAPDAVVGPTFRCLIGLQFFQLRSGDRFFYDLGGQRQSFSEPQLQQIRKSSWSRILCDTLGPQFGGDFTRVQPLSFFSMGISGNQPIDCDSLAIPKVDLTAFKE